MTTIIYFRCPFVSSPPLPSAEVKNLRSFTSTPPYFVNCWSLCTGTAFYLYLYLFRGVCLVLKSCVGVYIAFNTLHFVLIMPERPRPSGKAFIFEIHTRTVITLHFGLFVFHLYLSPSARNCHNSLVLETASLPNVVTQQSVSVVARKGFYHLSPRDIPFSPTLSTVAVTTSRSAIPEHVIVVYYRLKTQNISSVNDKVYLITRRNVSAV